MTGIRSKVVIAGVAALEMNIARLRYAVLGLLLGVAACGSSPPPSPPPPVTLHGVFIDYSPTNSGFDRASCASAEEGESWTISVEAGGTARSAVLTFGKAGAGYEPAVKVWECSGQWSATVPRSAAGYTITLYPTGGGNPSSVTVSAPYNGSSITLDDGGGDDGGSLELTPAADAALVSTALSQAAVAKAVAAAKVAAAKAAAEKKAAAERAHAIYEARLAQENTLISATLWNEVIQNPDNYQGDIYTISGSVTEYNINSNTLATQESAALVAVDGNGNDFVVEAPASVLGNAQPGDTFTAKVTVLGAEEAENTVYGGTSEVPDFDASTFTITG